MILMGLRRAKVWPNKNLDCLFAGCKAEKYEDYVLFGVWNVLVWLSIYPVKGEVLPMSRTFCTF